jgi:putative ABC transport system ATP-binding protein
VAEDTVIKLRDIRKSYGSGNSLTPVLRGVSLDVQRGEFLALIGQSGSGKSTLLNIIGGLDHADGGDVEVLGHDYDKTSEKRLARLRNAEIGFVFQAFNLLDHMTCIGNVTLPATFATGINDANERGMSALDRVGLAEYAHRRPSELSGGQKQRVAIARAMFRAPTLLLCDEPTGNLDSKTGAEVINFFSELNDEGTTLIIVTHEQRVSTVASRIIGIEDGQLIEGTEQLAAVGAGPA